MESFQALVWSSYPQCIDQLLSGNEFFWCSLLCLCLQGSGSVWVFTVLPIVLCRLDLSHLSFRPWVGGWIWLLCPTALFAEMNQHPPACAITMKERTAVMYQGSKNQIGGNLLQYTALAGKQGKAACCVGGTFVPRPLHPFNSSCCRDFTLSLCYERLNLGIIQAHSFFCKSATSIACTQFSWVFSSKQQ